MRRAVVVFSFLVTAVAAEAQDDVRRAIRVYEDAKVIHRIAEIGKRDIPKDLVEKIAKEDLDLLRGKRSDGTYEFAHYERQESARTAEEFGVSTEGSSATLRGDFVYQIDVAAPSRKYVVRRNKRVFVDRIEVEIIPMSGPSKMETIHVESWIEPGTKRTFDLPEIAKRATVTLYGKSDPEQGAGGLDMALIMASVADNTDSPWFSAAQNVKQLMQSAKRGDASSLMSMANVLRTSLETKGIGTQTTVAGATTSTQTPATTTLSSPPAYPPATGTAAPATASSDEATYRELMEIEDLLYGSDDESREGLARLHQLIRKLRRTQ